MKTKSTKLTHESKRPQRPYDGTEGSRKRSKKTENSVGSMQPSITPSSAPAPSTYGNEPVLLRRVRFEGSPTEIFAKLEEQLAYNASTHGRDKIIHLSKDLLDTYVAPTGFKPEDPLGDPKFVFVRLVPESKYSIGLFPGSVSAAEYCMDFVESATGKPVNPPFEDELWGITNTETPWLSVSICTNLRSIERVDGIKQNEISPGSEKFVLRDGQTCVLERPGKRPLRFTVPICRREMPAVVETQDIVELPKFIDM
ncbi:hypothetical protein BC628DRAFT_1417397 [Trametes gibbosa]|nr:hypothetical protein BC628DRAFT_1417397 [Trametes gibbosa]